MFLYYTYCRYGFQISGTLLAFAILFVLLSKLPKASNPEEYVNNTKAIVNCDAGDAPLNYGDRTAFWVRDTTILTSLCFIHCHVFPWKSLHNSIYAVFDVA